jgi:hypothetical protein
MADDYIAFDVLHFRKRDVCDEPIEDRQKYLAEIAESFVAPIQPILVFPEDVELETAIQVVKQTSRGWSRNGVPFCFSCPRFHLGPATRHFPPLIRI